MDKSYRIYSSTRIVGTAKAYLTGSTDEHSWRTKREAGKYSAKDVLAKYMHVRNLVEAGWVIEVVDD